MDVTSSMSKKARVRLRQSEVFFPLAYPAIVANSKAFSWSYPQSPRFQFDRAVPSTSPIKCGECQTQKIAGGEITGFETIGFKVPILNSGFKISGDMAKPGSFCFGFVHLRVNGKSNPVLKRSRIRHKSGTISSSVNLVLIVGFNKHI